jgi:hypothetical protein
MVAWAITRPLGDQRWNPVQLPALSGFVSRWNAARQAASARA